MTVVLDASALLAFVQGEPGADLVEQALEEGGTHCGAANWSEVAQKVIGHGRDWGLVRTLLLGYGVAIEAVGVDDAEWASRRWRRGEGLSLGDRLCLALTARLGCDVLTADATWGSSPNVRQVR